MEPASKPGVETSLTITSIKRKADEAFDALDDALLRRERRPSPPKRANTSIYGSLAKYGIVNKLTPTSKTTSTPTLTALLSRARSKKNVKSLPILQHARTAPTESNYSPGSTDAFLQRLSTFSFSTYSSKPAQIDAVAASKAGWINEGGKDRLYCTICMVGWVITGRDGLSKDAAHALVEKQRQSLVEMHKDGCPWRIRQCDPLVYRIPLQSPANLARQIKSRAIELEPVLHGILIRHPLSSNQVQTFSLTISSVPDRTTSEPSSPSAAETNGAATASTTTTTPVSTVSLLTSLFGWSVAPPPSPLPRSSSSARLALARSHSRAASVHSHAGFSRECTPAPDVAMTPPSAITSSQRPTTPISTPLICDYKDSSARVSRREPPLQKDAMLQCQMCQRRIGLWAFAAPDSSNTSADTTSSPQTISHRPQRVFDLLHEHRSYCPYVVKSTPLASLPSYSPPSTSSATPRSSFDLTRTGTSSSMETQNPTSAFHIQRPSLSLFSGMSSLARTNTSGAPQLHNNLVEGWRAVYSTVLRFGMAERSRVRMHMSPSSDGPPLAPQLSTAAAAEPGEKAEDDAVKSVIDLVEGVKRHGGRQLLSYVRSLLG